MNTGPVPPGSDLAITVSSDRQGGQPTLRAEHLADNSWSSTLSNLGGILALVAAIGLGANFLLFISRSDFYKPDSESYIVSAANLVKGHGFINSAGFPETTRTPGYPLLIAPFLRMRLDLKYLVVFQHLLQVLIALATAIFAYRLSQSRSQTLIAGILLCLDLPSLEAANSVMTETLFTAILTGAIWLLWISAKRAEKSLGWIVLAGFLAGWSVLVRPITTYFFVLAAVYLLLVGRNFKLRAVFAFVLAFASLPLAWAARNYAQTGYFTVSSISGWDMLGYRAAGVLAVNDGGDFFLNLDKRQTQLLHQVCDNTKGLENESCLPLTIPQTSIPQKARAYMKFGSQIVLQHPWAYAKIVARGVVYMMLGDDADLVVRLTGMNPRLIKGIILIYTVPALCLAIAGLFSLWNKNRTFFYLSILIVGYFVVISTGAEAHSRMRVPIMPIYAVLIAAGADMVIRRVSHRGMLHALLP